MRGEAVHAIYEPGLNREKKRQNPILVGLVLLFAGAAAALIQYKVPTIMTAVMDLFSMDADLGSWLMSIFTLMSIFVAVPSGILAQRFGAKRVMVAALILIAAGSLFGAFAQTSALILASRAVEGAALTVITTCGPVVVQRCVSPQRIGAVMGVWGIWGCVGSTVAAILTPTVFEIVGFRGVWVAYAVVAVAAALILVVAVRVPRATDEDAVDARPDVSRGEGSRWRDAVTLDVALFFVGFAAFNICLLAVLAYVPTILQMQGFDSTLSGLISTIPMLLSIVSSPLFGVLSDRMGRCKPLLLVASLAMGPCTFLFYTTTGTLLWVAAVTMGIVAMGGVGLFLSGYMKIMPHPERASIAMGLMILVQGLGQFLGTFLVQRLLGPDLTNWMGAGLALMLFGMLGSAAIALCKMK